MIHRLEGQKFGRLTSVSCKDFDLIVSIAVRVPVSKSVNGDIYREHVIQLVRALVASRHLGTEAGFSFVTGIYSN